MNFLAHLYLSGENEGIIMGNFFADAVKGNQLDHFPADVIKGIRIHREIDSYTDQHPVFLESKGRLSGTYRKFSGVIVDLYYDHFLARNWSEYSTQDLEEYVARSYKLLLRNYNLLPARSKRILPFMIAQNWLVGYSDFDKLERVFQGMSRRSRFKSGMENAVTDLKKDYSSYQAEFRKFFPDLINHVRQYRGNMNVE
jgi:acyl carrier protein phosphodiesterase